MKAILIAIFFLLVQQWACSQAELSLVGLRSVLESDVYNPAFFHQDGWHIGLPSLLYNIYHTGPGYNDLIDRTNGHVPLLRVSVLQSGLVGENDLSTDFRFQSFKLKYGQGNWSIGLDHEIIFHNTIEYPDALVNLFVDGNQQYIGKTIQIAPKGVIYSFNSYSATVSYRLPKITIGIRPRLLLGNHFGNTPQASALLTTSDEVYQIDLITNYRFDNVGLLSFDEANFLNYQIQAFDKWHLFSKNVGFALDAGVDLQISEDFRLGFSLIDFGSINWKDGVRSYISERNTRYEGTEINDLFNITQIGIDGALDSLSTIFDLTEKSEVIHYRLSSKWFSNINYRATEMLELSLIALYTGSSESPLSLGLQTSLHLSDQFIIGTMLSNRYEQFNLGLHGMITGKKWIGFIAADNILDGISPLTSSHFNVRLGLNLSLAGTSFD